MVDRYNNTDNDVNHKIIKNSRISNNPNHRDTNVTSDNYNDDFVDNDERSDDNDQPNIATAGTSNNYGGKNKIKNINKTKLKNKLNKQKHKYLNDQKLLDDSATENANAKSDESINQNTSTVDYTYEAGTIDTKMLQQKIKNMKQLQKNTPKTKIKTYKGGNLLISFYIFLAALIILFSLMYAYRENLKYKKRELLNSDVDRDGIIIEESQAAALETTENTKRSETFTLNDVKPDLFTLSFQNKESFLSIIDKYKQQLCLFAEQINHAHLGANNEILMYDLYSKDRPVYSYYECINPQQFSNDDLYNVYQKIYDGFILKAKSSYTPSIENTLSYTMNSYFNIAIGYPNFLKTDQPLKLIEFTNLIKDDMRHRIAFCYYNQSFVEVYNQIITNNTGEVIKINNCYNDQIDLSVAFSQYKIYRDYINPNSLAERSKEVQDYYLLKYKY